MKKQLLGTTALVAASMLAWSGDASAQKVQPVQVTIGGYYGQFLGYVDQDGRSGNSTTGDPIKFDTRNDGEMHFNGRTTLDNGITVGFRVELEANTSGDQIDESYAFVESRFGRLEMGSVNSVNYKMHYTAPDVFTRGFVQEGQVFDWLVNSTGSPVSDSMFGNTVSRMWDNDSDKINYYTPRIEGFQVGFSYTPESRQDSNAVPQQTTGYQSGWSAAANFVRTFGSFDIAASLGYQTWQAPDQNSAPDPKQVNAGLVVGFAGFKLGGSYGKMKDARQAGSGTNAAAAVSPGITNNNGRAWNLGGSYTFGPASVSLTYMDTRNDDSFAGSTTAIGDDKFTVLSLAGKYLIGPGVSVEAALFHGKMRGNNPTTSFDDNKATGFVTGILMVF
jgi:outer membrane protein OmpU